MKRWQLEGTDPRIALHAEEGTAAGQVAEDTEDTGAERTVPDTAEAVAEHIAVIVGSTVVGVVGNIVVDIDCSHIPEEGGDFGAIETP